MTKASIVNTVKYRRRSCHSTACIERRHGAAAAGVFHISSRLRKPCARKTFIRAVDGVQRTTATREWTSGSASGFDERLAADNGWNTHKLHMERLYSCVLAVTSCGVRDVRHFLHSHRIAATADSALPPLVLVLLMPSSPPSLRKYSSLSRRMFHDNATLSTNPRSVRVN
jgi:hypothetical protein